MQGAGRGTRSDSPSEAGDDRLQEAASGLAEQAGRTASTQLSSGLTRVGESLEDVAVAIRRAGDNLKSERPEVAGMVDTAAREVERAASYLRERDAEDLLRDAEVMARRQPAVFIGAAFTLGLLASRFLKSSPTGGNGGMERGEYGESGRSSRYASGYGRAVGPGETGSGWAGSGTSGTRGRRSTSTASAARGSSGGSDAGA